MAPERGEGQEGSPAAPAPHLPQPVIINGMQEGDSRGLEERSEDDDLTSLTWLQDKNLLKGINLRSNGGSGKQESPTSDYVEECGSECSSVTSSSPHPKHPHHIPYDPKVHITSKPPYSFSCLIFMSIEDSEGKALPVKEIYAWILEHFPYYRTAPTGWKNSVRHNLSLNKCFRKVDKAPNLGKGSLWMVDPVFRPNLVQALMKAPYHPYTNIDYSTINSRSSPVAGDEDSSDEIDDVGAAAAMLALKHGPNFTDHYHKRHLHPRVNGVRHQEEGRDHTYSAESPRDLSADEAFASDSNSSWSVMGGYDPEERRKTEEGADALLDLAGVPRGPPPSKRPKRRKPVAPQRTNR